MFQPQYQTIVLKVALRAESKNGLNSSERNLSINKNHKAVENTLTCHVTNLASRIPIRHYRQYNPCDRHTFVSRQNNRWMLHSVPASSYEQSNN